MRVSGKPPARSAPSRENCLRGAAGGLEQALTALGVDHDVMEYPDAGHAFLNDHRGEGLWSVLYLVLGHLPVIAGVSPGWRLDG